MEPFYRKVTSLRFLILIALLLTSTALKSQNSVSTLCGTSTQGSPLSGPNGVCLSPDGMYLYISDYSSHTIKRVDISTGNVITLAGNGVSGYNDGSMVTAQFYYPAGIKISTNGQFLFVADNGNCLIRKIDLMNSVVSTIAGVFNAFSHLDHSNGLLAEFNQPIDLALSGDTILYISDSENHVIRKMNLITTEVSTLAGIAGIYGSNNGAAASSTFRNPNGLSLSFNGSKLVIADAGNHLIRILDLLTLQVNTLAGNGNAGNIDNASGNLASFNTPQGVCMLPNDSLAYVTDTFNNLIRVIDLNTTGVSTIAGSVSTPTSHFADHNNGLQAKFYHPVNACLSNTSDKLYISDQENFRIRIMNTDLIITSSMGNLDNEEIKLYPNPIKSGESIYVTIPTSKYYQLTVINSHSITLCKTGYGPGPPTTIAVPSACFAPGLNLIQLNTELFTITKKIIVTD